MPECRLQIHVRRLDLAHPRNQTVDDAAPRRQLFGKSTGGLTRQGQSAPQKRPEACQPCWLRWVFCCLCRTTGQFGLRFRKRSKPLGSLCVCRPAYIRFLRRKRSGVQTEERRECCRRQHDAVAVDDRVNALDEKAALITPLVAVAIERWLPIIIISDHANLTSGPFVVGIGVFQRQFQPDQVISRQRSASSSQIVEADTPCFGAGHHLFSRDVHRYRTPTPKMRCGRVVLPPYSGFTDGLLLPCIRRTVPPGASKLLCPDGWSARYSGTHGVRFAGAASLWREGGEYNTRKGNKPACLWTGFEPLAASLAVESHACGAPNAFQRARA